MVLTFVVASFAVQDKWVVQWLVDLDLEEMLLNRYPCRSERVGHMSEEPEEFLPDSRCLEPV